MGTVTHEKIIEVVDEREPIAAEALDLILENFPPYDRHTLEDLTSEVAEKRVGLLDPYDFHLFTTLDGDGHPIATITGVYLAGVNAGFVTYLAVSPDHRGRQLGRRLRTHLVGALIADAKRHGRETLAWVLGEVRIDSRWLHGLVRHGAAIPLDLNYYHPGMTPGLSRRRYVLYREPVGDMRAELPAAEVRRLIYAVWRRGYRVSYPLQRAAFRAMIEELAVRDQIGAHPEVLQRAQAA